MKGTDKQIAFAKTCIDGAKAWYSQPYTMPSGIVTKLDREGRQLAAIEVIEAIERGDQAAAESAYENAAPWVGRCVVFDGDAPAIDAASVIDALKKAYYCAKDKGLVA